MAPKRTIDSLTQSITEWSAKLAKIGVAFLESREDLIEQIYSFEKSPSYFKTHFIQVATETQSMYIHPNLVQIDRVVNGHTIIRPPVGSREFVAQRVDEIIVKLTDMGLAFVLPREDLIEQIYISKTQPSHSPALFKRPATSEEPEYIHPTPVHIDAVLSGHTKIWSDADKRKHQDEVNATHFPRGVDSGGNKETARFKALMQLFSEIIETFDFEETTRGSFTDIIVTLKTDDKIVFGLQIATSDAMNRKHFNFAKTVEELIRYLDANLVVLMIAMVNNQVAGVYMIPPTQDIKDKLATFQGSLTIYPSLMNKRETQSDTLNHYLETFRYIHPKFIKDVKGDVKEWSTFPTDFMKLYKDYPSIVTTTEHLSSLSLDPRKRTEWICDMSFDVHVAKVLGITQKRIHGQRGDMHLDFGGEFQLDDERKTLGVKTSKTVVDVANSKSWRLNLRHMGRQGLHPSKVRVITGFIRSDRRQKYPSQLEQIIGFVLLCVITASGNLALCPNKPETPQLHMTCDVANRSDYIELISDKVGPDMYPGQETFMSGKKTNKTRLRAVFYYDELANPGGKRLAELRELYKTFASRTPTEEAIRAYETAVSNELIDDERDGLHKNFTCTL